MDPDTSNKTHNQDEEIFQRIERYPWNSDTDFQHGLADILSACSNEEEAWELTLKARCFYFSRKYAIPVDPQTYTSWHHSRKIGSEATSTYPSATSSAPTQDHSSYDQMETHTATDKGDSDTTPPYPLDFNRIVELITTGQTVPGIKDIPATVLEGQASKTTQSKRMKPWESEDT